MVANAKALEVLIDNLLRPEGFTRRGRTWRLDREDVVLVINLQKSDFGGQFFVNLGLFVKRIDGISEPEEHVCHLRARLCRICEDTDKIRECLDLERPMESNERSTLIRCAISKVALPLMYSMDSVAKMQAVFQQGRPRGILPTAKVHSLLGFSWVHEKEQAVENS